LGDVWRFDWGRISAMQQALHRSSLVPLRSGYLPNTQKYFSARHSVDASVFCDLEWTGDTLEEKEMNVTGRRVGVASWPNRNTIGSLFSEVTFGVQIRPPSNHNTIKWVTPRGNVAARFACCGRAPCPQTIPCNLTG
jgi:hypothetical protein